MFVSRKCLAARIHFFPRELSTCIHVTKLIHQAAIFLLSNLPARDPLQPVAEKLMQCGVLTAGFLSSQLDVGLIGIESNILPHDNSVHDTRVSGKHKLETIDSARRRRAPVQPVRMAY